jgi:type IV secretion system protein VirB9
MNRLPLAILSLALFASPVEAQSDPRLKQINYEANKIVKVQGRLGYQSMIEFGPGEQIENVAVGDSSAWQVTPNKRANLLFLKPLLGKAKTNMTVVTDQRVYLFDLGVALARNSPLYNLRFTYDAAEPNAPQRVRYPNLLSEVPVSTATGDSTAQLPNAITSSFAWKRKGKKDLLPASSYDDGRRLYLQWRAGAPLPALFTRDGKGEEMPANYQQIGTYIVIDHIPTELVMRLGTRTAVLINRKKPDAPVRVAER